MAGEHVTLLWIADGAPHASGALREIESVETDVVETSENDLEAAIAKARTRGGVVAIGSSDRLSSLLELGADEVASWNATPQTFGEIVRRARARAQWRATNRDVQSPELTGLAFLSAAIGHEIRNPLAAAMINCTTLENLVGPVEAQSELHGTLSDLNEALRNIADVVSQMVALADPGEVGVCDLSRTLVELTTYVHKEVEVVADFEAEIPNEPCPVALPRTRAVEIVASLLNNAVYAVEAAERRRGRITLRLTIEAQMIVVEVSDNGVGMTSDVRRRALHAFFTKGRPGSTGMGLAFAAMHVRRAGGEVLIDSEVNVGTSVRAFLPKIPPPPESSTRIKN